jgi:hypothetical protein
LKIVPDLFGADFDNAFPQYVVVSQQRLKRLFWDSRNPQVFGGANTRVAASRTAGKKCLFAKVVSGFKPGQDHLASMAVSGVNLCGAGQYDKHRIARLTFAQHLHACGEANLFAGARDRIELFFVEAPK